MKKEKGLISVLMLPIIATLILGVGIYVYNSSYSAISDTAGQMRDMENDIYNSMINMYIGDSQKGSDVKKMIASKVGKELEESRLFEEKANNIHSLLDLLKAII